MPLEGVVDVRDYVAFYWDKVDAWFEEDEEVFGHAKDPYKRVDCLQSSRRVTVVVNGEHLGFAITELREMKMQPSLERALTRQQSLKN